MTVLKAAVLGLVQGLTEFLPVSSSGHLTLAERAMGIEMDDLVALDVALHGATLGAILVYFGRTWMRRLVAEPRLFALALAAGVPAAAVHFAGGERLVEAAKSSIAAVAALFVAGGGFLIFASFHARGSTELAEVRRRNAEQAYRGVIPEGRRGAAAVLAVGAAQAAALFPGVSRSGSTMGAGLLSGLTREAAFEFSFLAGTPLLAGAVLVKSLDIGGIAAASGSALAAGTAVAFASGLAALAALRRVVTGGKLWAFGVYTALVGIGCLVWAATGWATSG